MLPQITAKCETRVKLGIAPPENMDLFSYYANKSLQTGLPITFFSWKMVKTVALENGEGASFSSFFDHDEATQYIEPERRFLKVIQSYNLPYNYVKIVPDDLIEMFWGRHDSSSDTMTTYAMNVESYFKEVYPPTRTILFSDLLKENNLWEAYLDVFKYVYDSFSEYDSPFVDPEKFTVEVSSRKKMHNIGENDNLLAKEISKRAFSLFAAESSMLFQLSNKGVLPQLVLLAGSRSVDTYKYEFLRIPESRPTLPKLFVI